MPDELADLLMPRRPTPDRPLLGLTILIVEDSRFACEAMRLLCQRSGARLRRADSLSTARRHLSLYRPTTVVIDIGLPDGSGTELLEELNRASPRVPVLIAVSGDPELRQSALDAGAQVFLEKPFHSLGAFQEAVLHNLPDAMRPMGPRAIAQGKVSPDEFALRDDLSRLAELIDKPCGRDQTGYAAQFLSSIACSANDSHLAEAARSLQAVAGQSSDQTRATLKRVSALLHSRLELAAPI